MKYTWKIRDFFYNNGIVNLFWATQKRYSIAFTQQKDYLVLKPLQNMTLKLFSRQMVIEGDESEIRQWYKEISHYFIRMGLQETPRIVFDKSDNKLKEGFSFRQRCFTARIWGTAIGSKLISAPSLDKNLPSSIIQEALKNYELQKGKSLEQLSQEGLFKKSWSKDGVYIPVGLEMISEGLFKNRHHFEEETNEQCEICGSNLVKFDGEKYRRDSQTHPAVIGINYSGFKEFMQNKSNIVCAFCDLALRYNFFWSFYAAGKPNILLHIDYPDLISLFQLKNDVFEIKMEDITGLNQSTNIPFPGLGYYISAERAILGLALYVADRIASDENYDISYVTGDKSYFVRIFSFYFDSTKVSQLTEYHQFNRLVSWLSQQPKQAFVNVFKNGLFRLESKNNKYLLETQFLHKMLYFQDISAELAEIAFLKIRGTKAEPHSAGIHIHPFPVSAEFENLIINYLTYIKEPVMNEEQLQLLKDYGWAIGTLAREVDDLTIFYELRDAKKLDHVNQVMRNFSFKLLREENSISRENSYVQGALGRFVSKDLDVIQLFEELQNEWSKARDLLLFFAVNNYLKKYDSK